MRVYFHSYTITTVYSTLIVLHNAARWLVLLMLLWAIYRSWTGYYRQRDFTLTDDRLRHWTATSLHVQLILGMLLYVNSPTVRYFYQFFERVSWSSEAGFFGWYHIGMMLTAIVTATVVSMKAKRAATARQQFKVMGRGYAVVLLLLILAIPWGFSTWVARAYFRSF